MDRCEVGEAGRSLGIAVSSRPCDFPDVNGMLRLTPRRVKNLPLFYSDRNCSALYVQLALQALQARLNSTWRLENTLNCQIESK